MDLTKFVKGHTNSCDMISRGRGEAWALSLENIQQVTCLMRLLIFILLYTSWRLLVSLYLVWSLV